MHQKRQKKLNHLRNTHRALFRKKMSPLSRNLLKDEKKKKLETQRHSES